MNKQMIVVAVVSALAASSVMADTVNVNVYGRIRGAVEGITGSGATTGNNQVKQARVVNNVSILGFKGTEDLGDGLIAMWQAEGQVYADGDTDGKLNSRNTFFALKTDSLGTLLVGKNDTPYKLSRKPLVADIFEDSTVQISAIFAKFKFAAKDSSGDFYTRQKSTIQYLSPVLSGFDFKLGIAPDEVKTASSNAFRLSSSVSYNNDFAFATAALENRKAAAGVPPALDSATAWTVNGGYKIGKNGSVGAGFEKLRMGNATQRNLILSANYKFADKFVVAANAAQASDVKGVADSGARMFTIGGQYEFSKRTSVSLYASLINNESAAAYNFGENGIDKLANGKDPRVIGLGYTQKF